MLNSPFLLIRGYLTYLVYKKAFFQFNQFLDSGAEIHHNFLVAFLENLRDQKVILKLTDLLKT
jgi:hypothetical protein